jgi:ubiquinone/menaquinone biosynthesis C-methylase UbiE
LRAIKGTPKQNHPRGLACVQKRPDALPECYSRELYNFSNNIPIESRSNDVIVAGESFRTPFSRKCWKILCEFQRILKMGGKLLMTTPNPDYLKREFCKTSVYCDSHLIQHFSGILHFQMKIHEFSPTLKSTDKAKYSDISAGSFLSKRHTEAT